MVRLSIIVTIPDDTVWPSATRCPTQHTKPKTRGILHHPRRHRTQRKRNTTVGTHCRRTSHQKRKNNRNTFHDTTTAVSSLTKTTRESGDHNKQKTQPKERGSQVTSPAQTHSPSQKLLDGASVFAAIVRPDEGETAAVRGEKEARAT